MRDALTAACFVLTGAAGLVYEVCWIRRASLAFGSTTYALSTVLAAYFLGLAVGSDVVGRVSRRITHPLRWYAMLELGVAALALASLPAFDLAERLYGVVHRATETTFALRGLARFGLVSLVLVPPTFLMGGTLPLFCRHYVADRSRIARPVGVLYALNTLGAAAGCALAGLYLLPRLGLAKTVFVGVTFNVVAAVVVASLQWSRHATVVPSTAPHASTAMPHRRAVVALVFLVGATGLGYQVLWSRFLSLVVRNTVDTYTLTLGTFLVGIVLGSLLASAASHRRAPRGVVFAALQLALGISVLMLMLMPPDTWLRMESSGAVYAALLLVPAVLSGAAFPLAVGLAVDDPAAAGAGVGRIAAASTAGGIVGALVTGFVVLPGLGLHSTLLSLTGLSIAAGLFALWALDATGVRARLVVASVAVVAWLAVPWASATRIPDDFLAPGAELVDVREGLESNLAVVRRGRTIVLEINRWWQGQERASHQIMAAHLPMLLHPEARRVLVVGVGAGQTPARFLLHRIERLDAVDIEPAVFDLIRPHFRSIWMDDPRVTLRRADGRNVLAHTAQRWDVISLEVGQLFHPGVASFYTADFYRRARARLEPGGMLCQFMPLPFFSVDTFRSAVASFLDAFPSSQLWYNTSELLLVGVNADGLHVSPSRLAATMAVPAIRDDLSFSYWGGPAYRLARPENVLGGFLAGPRGLAAIADGAPILTDDRPILDYATTTVTELDANELPIVDLLRRHLDPVASIVGDGLEPRQSAEIDRVRERNLGDIAASALMRRAEALRATVPPSEVASMLAEAASHNPENVRVQRLLGDALVLSGRFDDARVAFERAITLEPSDALAHRGLGVVLHRAGRLDEAAAHYEATLNVDPDDAEAHNNLGAALGSRGDYVRALEHFERAVALRPDYPDARRNRDRLRAHLGAADAR